MAVTLKALMAESEPVPKRLREEDRLGLLFEHHENRIVDRLVGAVRLELHAAFGVGVGGNGRKERAGRNTGLAAIERVDAEASDRPPTRTAQGASMETPSAIVDSQGSQVCSQETAILSQGLERIGGSIFSLNEKVLDEHVADAYQRRVVDEHVAIDLDKQRWCIFWAVESVYVHPYFLKGAACLIATNALLIGVQADWVVKHVGSPVPLAFRALDAFFAFAFALELLVRLLAERRKFCKIDNANLRWNVFDSTLAVFGLFDEALKIVLSRSMDIGAVRALRLLRLVRVARVLRVARFFGDLRVMVAGIMCSMKSLMWAAILLLMVAFVFGVCIMDFVALELQENGDSDPDEAQKLQKYWGSLLGTLFMLYQSITGGVDWEMLVRPLMKINPVLGPLFAAYISVAVFCVPNVITALFVENAKKLTMQDEANMLMASLNEQKQWLKEVTELWAILDENCDDQLEGEEFARRLGSVRSQLYFAKLGLSVESEGAPGLFSLLDLDGNGVLTFEEFALGIQMLHGSAKNIDMARLRHQIGRMQTQLAELAIRGGVETTGLGRGSSALSLHAPRPLSSGLLL